MSFIGDENEVCTCNIFLQLVLNQVSMERAYLTTGSFSHTNTHTLYTILFTCTTEVSSLCPVQCIYIILLHDEAIHQRREVCNIKSNAHFGVH